MKSDEYLESVFKEAFNRELDVDENVARTLPFFAATLALVATLYGYATTKLPTQWSGLALLLYALLLFGALCLAGVVYSLFQAVRAREYRIPPKETELLAWAEGLKTYFEAEGVTADDIDVNVTAALRLRMIGDYAQGAEHNRQANVPKLRARARGFTLLVAALGIAFLMIGIIFTADRVGSAGQARDTHERREPNSSKARGAAVGERPSGPAPAPPAAGDSGGFQIPRHSGGEHGHRLTEPSARPPVGSAPPKARRGD